MVRRSSVNGRGRGQGGFMDEYILRPLRVGMWGCEAHNSLIQVKLLNSTSGFSGVPSTLVNIYLNCNKTDIVA